MQIRERSSAKYISITASINADLKNVTNKATRIKPADSIYPWNWQYPTADVIRYHAPFLNSHPFLAYFLFFFCQPKLPAFYVEGCRFDSAGNATLGNRFDDVKPRTLHRTFRIAICSTRIIARVRVHRRSATHRRGIDQTQRWIRLISNQNLRVIRERVERNNW